MSGALPHRVPNALADLGGVPGLPLGVQILSFDIQNFQNVTALGVNAPLGVRRPPTGNPESATVMCTHDPSLGLHSVLNGNKPICSYHTSVLCYL